MPDSLKNVDSERNYGIDLLRIICMVMIVIHHVLLHGGILREVEWFCPQYKEAWFLEAGVFCAVNAYGIISGYVGNIFRKKKKTFLFSIVTLCHFVYNRGV